MREDSGGEGKEGHDGVRKPKMRLNEENPKRRGWCVLECCSELLMGSEFECTRTTH